MRNNSFTNKTWKKMQFELQCNILFDFVVWSLVFNYFDFKNDPKIMIPIIVFGKSRSMTHATVFNVRGGGQISRISLQKKPLGYGPWTPS